MWELLKKIAKAGWKPYGKGIDELTEEEKNIRLITSRNSGLWQFVCENGMTEKHTDLWVRCNEKTSKTYQDSYTNQNYGYWLLESSLKDESELEDFLLQNIKIDG